MYSNEAIVSNLKNKLKYSLKFSEILDSQFDALKSGDSRKLVNCINLMDECHARLKDIDRILKKNGFKGFSMEKVGENTSLLEDEDILGLFLKTREVVMDSIEKLDRNRNVVESIQGELREEMKELTKSTQLKNYFESAEAGNFLNFSG